MPDTAAGAGAQFARVRLRSPADFQPGTFVTLVPDHSPTHRVIAGVLKREKRTITDGPNKGRPQLTAQAVLHPIGEQGPCAVCDVEKLNAKGRRR